MTTVGFWTVEGDVTRAFDIILVKHSEVDFFRDVVAAEEVSRPQKLYVIAPNGYGSEDFLAHYVGFKNQGDTPCKIMVSESCELRETLLLWDELVTALENFDHSGALLAIKCIRTASPSLATRKDEVLGLMEQYVTECITPIADHALCSSRNDFWWQQPMGPLKDIQKFCDQVAQKSSAIPEMKWIGGVAAHLMSRFTSMAGKNTGEKFYGLSTFCIGLAKKQIPAQRLQSAFLLCYRALDLYFQSLALAEGVMIEVAGGINYRSAPTDRVYLVDTEFKLVAAGKLRSDIKRRDFIVEINGVRNQMLLTHGGHSVTAIEAKRYLDGCCNLVKQIEGHDRWIVYGGLFFPSLSNYLGLVFASIPDIQTYVEEQAL